MLAELPVWAALVVPGGTALPLAAVVAALVAGILVPLLLGFAIHGATASLTLAIGERWAAPISTLALAILLGDVLVRDGAHRSSARSDPGSPASRSPRSSSRWGLAGGSAVRPTATRRSAGRVSSVRADTLALAVAGTAFGLIQPATSAIVVFGLCSLVVAPLAALAIGWRADRAGLDGL